MSGVAVVSPHPDDETLGCGGTLLRHGEQGDQLDWIIFTEMREAQGFELDRIDSRQSEIERVASRYNFTHVAELGFPAAGLEQVEMRELVDAFADVLRERRPQVLYVPFRHDAHTDHRVVYDVVSACSKWFRHPSVRRILAYETLSETNFGLRSGSDGNFVPNVYVDIEDQLGQKLAIMEEYASELGAHPFPRSETAIRSLAELRGSESGFEAAEAFSLLLDRRGSDD